MHGNNKSKKVDESLFYNSSGINHHITSTHTTGNPLLHERQDCGPKIRGYNQKLIIAELIKKSL